MELTPNKTLARDFFLYLLAIVTLYIGVWRLIDLLFEYINKLFPDPLETTYYMGSFENIRLSIATLIVVFPVYLGVTWYLRKDAIANPEKRELRVRKWLLNLTLFVAAFTIIVDLITLLNTFLNGDLTLRFFLKVVVVLVVSGAVLAYYLWDLRRETLPNDKPSKTVAILAAAVVLISIISGFFIIGSPATQRLRKFDDRRLNDLQMTQNEIINFWIQKSRLPITLDEMKNDVTGFIPPVDPVDAKAYEYTVKGAHSFELCAVFTLPTDQLPSDSKYPRPISMYGDPYSQNWSHAAGRACFERNIDPELYKPVKAAPIY